MVKLFSEVSFKDVTLKNRIAMSPMCMYSANKESGNITPFHHTHYVSRAIGQVGLIITEATAVQKEGCISENDLGIWKNGHIEGLRNLNTEIHKYGTKTAIQLAHAGRKAILEAPAFAPSAIPFDTFSKVPVEMTISDIKETITAFTKAAIRAKEAQFDIIEIHAAHGYLINQFLSPLTNKRTDNYGGNLENQYRFLKEIISSIQTVWHGPLFVRISTDEYHIGGNTLDDILYYSEQMKKQKIDLIDASSGGVVPTSINTYPGYQINRCQVIKHQLNFATGAVGLITNGIQAEEILQNERADLILLGRSLLHNPYWANVAAAELNYKLDPPTQYRRGW